MKTTHPSPSFQPLASRFAIALALILTFVSGTASAGLSEDWHFSSAYPTSNSFNAVWAQSPDSVYVAGDGGAIFHWDGSSWTEMETPTERPLFGIHGSSSTNIWAVGGDSYQSTNDDRSVILHYDGTSWNEMPAPVDWAGQRLTLSEVWVQSPTEVWAIIDSYLSLFKWDGTKWNDIDFQGSIAGAFVEGSMNDVQWVDGLGLFMVGTHGQVVHFDGTNWTLEQQLEQGNFSTSILTTIHAVDADHVYAGHNWGTVYKRNPDGTWTDLELSDGGFFGSGQILDIRGNSPDDLYFFTDRKIRHFTGSAPTANTDFGRQVRGSWNAADSSGDQFFIVDNQGGVFQYDIPSSTLSPLTVKGEASFNGRLNGATAYGNNGLLLFGDGQHYPDPAMALATSNGTSITRFPPESLPEGASHNANMIAAATGADGEITVVFDDFQTRWSGIYTMNGGDWTRLQGEYFTSNGLNLDYSSSGKLYMCDSQRVAVWNDPASPSVEILRLTLEEANQGYFTALWTPEDDRVYVGGHDGQIRRWDGTTWHGETTIADTEIGAIAGNDDHLYAIAYDDGSFRETGHLWHRSPSGTWAKIELLPELAIKPIGFASGSDGIYFAYATPAGFIGGSRTFVTKLNGSTVLNEVSGLSSQYETITSNARGDIFLIHSSGSFLTNRNAPENFSSTPVSYQAGTWHEMNDAGIQVTSNETEDGQSYFVGWRSSGITSSDLLPAHFQPGGEQWTLSESHVGEPGEVPTFRFRFTYDPDLLPASFDPARVVMLRFDGTSWEAVPAIVNEATGYIETTSPTSTSTWVVGVDLREPIAADALSIETGEADTIILSWSADIVQVLHTSTDLTPGSWIPVDEVPELLDGRYILNIPRSETQRFYRLGE